MQRVYYPKWSNLEWNDIKTNDDIRYDEVFILNSDILLGIHTEQSWAIIKSVSIPKAAEQVSLKALKSEACIVYIKFVSL